MYASIRRYEGLSRNTIEEVIKRSREGFVPIISASAGFISYNFIDSGDGVVAIHSPRALIDSFGPGSRRHGGQHQYSPNYHE